MQGRISVCTGPVAGAFVFIPGQSFNVVTNAAGQFTFLYVPAPPSGSYDLAVTVPGQPARLFPAAVSFLAGQATVTVPAVQLSDTTSDANNCGTCGTRCNSGDTCANSICQPGAPTPVCGDGVVQAPEQCDDGNTNNGDRCSATCTNELLAANGVTCSQSASCASGNCVDGLCTDTACGGQCRRSVNGVCTNIGAGFDPDDECQQQSAATCGQTGACDGAGACQLYSSGSVCRSESCSGSTLSTQGTCDGAGSCIGAIRSCAPFTCGAATACATTCSTNADCASGYTCTNNVCQ